MLIQIFLHKIYYRLGWRRWASLLWHVTCHVGVTGPLLTRVRVPCRLVNPGFPLSALFVAFVIIIISRILIVALIIIMIISIQFSRCSYRPNSLVFWHCQPWLGTFRISSFYDICWCLDLSSCSIAVIGKCCINKLSSACQSSLWHGNELIIIWQTFPDHVVISWSNQIKGQIVFFRVIDQ